MSTVIVGLLVIVAIYFSKLYFKDAMARKDEDNANPIAAFIIGFIGDFLDTLGIGSFATETAALKFSKQIDDKLLPGTLNVANTLPAMLEAMIFIRVVDVETFTLVTLITASVLGAYIAAGIIAKLPKRTVKIVMGFALIAVAIIMIVSELGLIARLGDGNNSIGLHGLPLVIGAIVFFVLGALMSAGVGLFAPAMATVYLLGLSPLVAFPIMMGSCAFLMPVGSIKFIKEKAYAPKLSLFITFGGLIGVALAAGIVKSLDLSMLTKVVIGVVIVTGVTMLYEAFVKDKKIIS